MSMGGRGGFVTVTSSLSERTFLYSWQEWKHILFMEWVLSQGLTQCYAFGRREHFPALLPRETYSLLSHLPNWAPDISFACARDEHYTMIKERTSLCLCQKKLLHTCASRPTSVPNLKFQLSGNQPNIPVSDYSSFIYYRLAPGSLVAKSPAIALLMPSERNCSPSVKIEYENETENGIGSRKKRTLQQYWQRQQIYSK